MAIGGASLQIEQLREETGGEVCYDATAVNRKYKDRDGIFVDLRAAEKGFWDERVASAADPAAG